MNIIKFTDTTLEGSEYTWYNENLRDKYAYWLHCQYAVPFDSIDPISLYNEYEKNISEFLESGIEYADTENDVNIQNCIDPEATEAANNIDVYKSYNKFIPDTDIKPEELKQFRTWLAHNLLLIIPDLTDDEKCMLEYYENDMTDATIDGLHRFGATTVNMNSPLVDVNKCGCAGSTNVSSLYSNGTISVCDPELIYRTNLHIAMVNMFSNIDTWLKRVPAVVKDKFYTEFISYIQGILDYNYPLYNPQSTYFKDVYSCKCVTGATNPQEIGRDVLNRLKKSLEWIMGGETSVSGNKNFIYQALFDWSDDLYEIMQW